jgi:flagellar protein FliS
VYGQTHGIHAYRQVQVETRSPLELVVMLYDGALASLEQANKAFAAGDVKARGAAISKTLAIVGALREGLDMDAGGDIAIELERLYDYMSRRLLDVTVKRDATAIDETHKLLAGLRDAWQQIATQPSALR